MQTVRRFPELVDYYIRFKEEHGDRAVSISDARVKESEQLYVRQIGDFVAFLAAKTDFYKDGADS